MSGIPSRTKVYGGSNSGGPRDSTLLDGTSDDDPAEVAGSGDIEDPSASAASRDSHDQENSKEVITYALLPVFFTPRLAHQTS